MSNLRAVSFIFESNYCVNPEMVSGLVVLVSGEKYYFLTFSIVESILSLSALRLGLTIARFVSISYITMDGSSFASCNESASLPGVGCFLFS